MWPVIPKSNSGLSGKRDTNGQRFMVKHLWLEHNIKREKRKITGSAGRAVLKSSPPWRVHSFGIMKPLRANFIRLHGKSCETKKNVR
jgi:hypothetical protein